MRFSHGGMHWPGEGLTDCLFADPFNVDFQKIALVIVKANSASLEGQPLLNLKLDKISEGMPSNTFCIYKWQYSFFDLGGTLQKWIMQIAYCIGF